MVPRADPKMTDVSQQEMSIGAFARLTNLTHEALLVYEREGLLGPARIDPSNGYRWYAAEINSSGPD
jgi:hypothetical protein